MRIFAFNTLSNASYLKISDLQLWVHLGVSKEEKENPQAVSVTIVIHFSSAPRAIKTDALTDTFCYFQMAEYLHNRIKQYSSFNLIEHLTGYIYACVYHQLLTAGYQAALLEISVTKKPPIPYMQGGVSFTYQGSLEHGVLDDLYAQYFSPK